MLIVRKERKDMTAKQRIVSIKQFTQEMLKADTSFADRVQQFEERFGEADENTLAVLAQAAYCCRVNCEYKNNLIQACKAVVSDFLVADYRGEGVSWDWFIPHAEKGGITANFIFKQDLNT